MNVKEITPLIITCNEQDNIARTLAALEWARRIVVVDSGSNDNTLVILRSNPAVEIHARLFDNFADQCAFGLSQVLTPFTLSLDADHVMTPELLREIEACDPEGVEGWVAPFRYCIGGAALRSSLLPPRIVLFRTECGVYQNDGHAHRVVVRGGTARFRAALLHDDRKPLGRWLSAQVRYIDQEADKLVAGRWDALRWPDRLRRLYLGPLLILPYCLLVKGLVLDGTRGLFYSVQRLYAEVLLVLFLIEKRRTNK